MAFIERVLNADSNEPWLMSIRKQEPSEKDDANVHVTKLVMTCALLSFQAAKVADLELVAVSYDVPSRATFFLGVFLIKMLLVCLKDDGRDDCSGTTQWLSSACSECLVPERKQILRLLYTLVCSAQV